MHNSKYKALTSIFVGALLVITSPILVYADPYGVDTDPSYVTTEQQNDWYSDVSLSSGHTVDKVRTSDTYYRTVAITVTRCAPGTMTPVGESYMAEVYNTSCTQDNGKQYNVFGTSFEDFIGNASASWQAEYNAAKYGDFDGDYYIRIDCVMAVCENGHWLTNPDGSLKTFGTYDGIANAEPWANKNGLKTHFNKYIKITKNKDALQKLKNKILPAAADSGDGNGGGGLDEYDYQLTHDETAPIEYHEGNSSPDGFDIGTGIPTTEKLHNEYDATSWWAKTDVRRRVKFWDEYHKEVQYHFQWWDGHSYNTKEVEHSDGTVTSETDYDSPVINSGTWGHGKVDVVSPFKTQEWQMIPIVSYQYLANTQCLDFSDAEVKQKTFENGSIKYRVYL